MGSLRLSSKKILDRKLCYELWVGKHSEYGRLSIYKIPRILAEMGVVNQEKGRNVTPQGVWRAANLYILEFPEIAKKDTVSIFSQFGKILDDDEWGKEMIGRARQFLSRSSYRNFLKDNPEYVKYE